MMKYIRSIRDKIDNFIYDHNKDAKDRAFVLFSICLLGALVAALVIGLFLNEPLGSTTVSLIIIVICSFLLRLVVVKNKIKGAKIVLAFLVVGVITPAMFFTKGGIFCGSPMSLLLGAYYLVLVLDGRFRIIMCAVNFFVMMACYFAAYFNPELVTEYSRRDDYIYSFSKFYIAWLVLTIIITFQTRIYQQEAKLSEEKTKELEEMNKAQNRFFSSMSHEIRTPINTVLGLNEIILRQEDASPEIKKDAKNIQGAGKLLLSLINDILDVSKIEAGKMDIVPVDYDVASLLSEIVNMIWLKAEEKGLKFNVDVDPDVPATLFGDEIRIKQVLINLLNNAVKYTSEGAISLHMECENLDSGTVMLNIVVEDTGMGIKPESLPHLFDTFQRVDEEKNRYIEGTGLGLSIVKQLVELMDGTITVNSVYTQGSAFSVMLKQGISSDKRIGEVNIANIGDMSGNSGFEHLFQAPNASILIVDDNEMNLEVECKLLDGTGINVETSDSGADALTKTLKKQYDLIFMDHLMPEMDGIECYKKIRKQEGGFNRNVPIIVLTANAGGENLELYNNIGFDGYLVKPVSGKQLEEMILTHLPEQKVQRNLSAEMAGTSLNTAAGYSKKKPVVIATSSMIDIPQSVLDALDIHTVPYTVITDEGVFYDNIDIDSEELIRYMRDESKYVSSEPPTEDDLVDFFSKELKRAHQVIYITLTTGSSREYGWALKAADTFENVHVFNSENLSSGTGILVMIAGRLVQQNLPVDRIIAELESAKRLIKCGFVIRSTDVMARRERISPFMNNLLKSLWLRPMLKVKNDKLGVGRFLFGSEKKCYEKYIKHAIPATIDPDRSFVFVTYAGMEEEELIWIENKLKEWIRFDHVIFQKASAGITSNCGDGTFGLIYMVNGNRNYNLGACFDNIDPETDDHIEEEYIVDYVESGNTDRDQQGPKQLNEKSSENKEAKQWYEDTEGLDPETAIKNSGSLDSFLSVIKIYYDSYKDRADEISDFYDRQDWENYTIKVHALKSSSRLVGAVKLGDKAQELETAGKNSDIEYIHAHHDDFMKEFKDFVARLEPVFNEGNDKEPIPEDELSDAYAELKDIAENEDYDTARMVLDYIGDFKLPPDDEDRFDNIEKSLSELDWDEIRRILDFTS